jgi:hypothetical protein
MLVILVGELKRSDALAWCEGGAVKRIQFVSTVPSQPSLLVQRHSNVDTIWRAGRNESCERVCVAMMKTMMESEDAIEKSRHHPTLSALIPLVRLM